MTGAARPERGAVLELRELLDEIDALASEGDRTRYDEDRRYRWVIHHLWIAVGNEAAAREAARRHVGMAGAPVATQRSRPCSVAGHRRGCGLADDEHPDRVAADSPGRHPALIGRLRSSEMNHHVAPGHWTRGDVSRSWGSEGCRNWERVRLCYYAHKTHSVVRGERAGWAFTGSARTGITSRARSREKESTIDPVEAAVSLAVSLDRLRILNAAWQMGKQSPVMSLEMLDASEQVRLAIVALTGDDAELEGRGTVV